MSTATIFLTTATGIMMKRDLPTLLTTTTEKQLPKLTTTSTGESFSTPPIGVPPSHNNPYIIRQHNPSGTVFIAVGAIVGAILLGFVLYHFIVSVTASRLAKKSLASDKQMYEKYHNNNNTAYASIGGSNMTPQTSLNFNGEYLSKFSFLTPSRTNLGFGGSQVGDNSTIYASESGTATSKHDLTKMFISPTAEVMQHKRVRSNYGGSSLNLSLFGGVAGSSTNVASPHRASKVPSMYMNSEGNNSESSFSVSQTQNALNVPGNKSRKTIPSMYLEDLIDK